ncbi:patellin-3-like [Gastrolobium bilobum]|uniref:patellin-3-like n=1 Tax=Gastrolobium bilobum TaxID=150636 RepID=UPI002AB13FDD|nr:patellin-3-like [Gastrolobium bilobum]
MAEETQKPTEEVVTAVDADKDPAADASAAPAEEKPPSAEEVEKPLDDKIPQSVSFKEETNVVGDLPEAEKKALDELKHLIQEALNKHELTTPPPPPKAPEVTQQDKKQEDKKEEIITEEQKKEEVAEVEQEQDKKEEATEVEKKAPEVAEEEKKAPEVTEEEKKAAEVTEEEKKEEEAIEDKPVSASEEPIIEVKPEAETATTGEEKKGEAVEEDGEKTVEAIKETIVSVSAPAVEEAPAPPSPEEVEIWGIPLLADERSDVILLKFLRARDFKVKDAFAMIKNTVRWRKEFGADALVDEDLGSDWDRVVFTHGYDKEGHPVCYNVFGEFENKELYNNTFSDEEKRNKFIRWRTQFLEKSVRNLEYSPTGISTIVQVNDLRNSPGLGKRELRQATNQALQLLQDNYPEFVAKQIFINVPWWYLAFSRMISAFLTQRTKSKFVFAGPSKSAETLFKYIAPELVPVQYGGLSREGEQEFTNADPVTEVTIKPATKHTVEFPVSEKSHLVWEVRVVGWDVNYGAEFVPSTEDGYTVLVQKSRKIAPADETVITNSFKIGEPGKVVLTIDNQTSKRKKLLYRSKTKAISE